MLTLHVYGSENYTVKKKWIQALFSIRQLDLQCKSSLINHLTLLSLSGLLTGGCISRRRLPGATVTAHSSWDVGWPHIAQSCQGETKKKKKIIAKYSKTLCHTWYSNTTAGSGRPGQRNGRQAAARARGEGAYPAAFLLQESLGTLCRLHTPRLSECHCR